MHNRLQANLLKDAVLKNIDQNQLTPTPDNYRLWFEYAASNIEALNAKIDSCITEKSAITDALCRKLYTQFVATKDQQEMDGTRIALGDMLEAMLEHFKLWDSSNDKFCSTLTNCAEQLDKEPDIAAIKSIVEILASEAKNTLVESQQLKSALSTLTTEITTLREDVDKLGSEALTDALTQVTNRRGFDRTFVEFANSADKEKHPLSLVVIDIDDFKRINDSFGHATGDKILKYLAATLRNAIRGSDSLARYGGEEFTIILPNTDLTGATKVAANLLTAISARQLTTGASNQIIGRITASIGVSQYRSGETLKSLFKRADQAMYTGKRGGKNRVVSEADLETSSQPTSDE